jgi:hypothetical protein
LVLSEWLTALLPSVEREYSYFCAVAPVLTARATQETPQPGSSAATKAMPSSFPSILEYFSVVEPEDTKESRRISLDDGL